MWSDQGGCKALSTRILASGFRPLNTAFHLRAQEAGVWTLAAAAVRPLGGWGPKEVFTSPIFVNPACVSWRLPELCAWAKLVPEPPWAAYLLSSSREQKPGQTRGFQLRSRASWLFWAQRKGR